METKVKTKLSKNETEGRTTQLTIEFDGTPEQMQELAKRSIVIQWQSIVRASGIIPEMDTIKVSELFLKVPRVKKQPTVTDVLALAKANPEFMAELLKQIGGNNAN